MNLQRRRPRELITIFFLVVAVSGTWWWLERTQREEDSREESQAHQPNAFFQDFIVTTMNEAGRPAHRITGQRMNHFPDNDTAELIEPRLWVYQEGDSPWEVQAQTAVVQLSEDIVWLLGSVKAERHPRDGQSIVIETSDLRVEPEREYAETDQPVTVHQPHGVTNGVGMQGWLTEKRFSLLAQVRGRYEPPAR